MYQHALALVFLSEVYGMTANPRIRSALINGINLTVRTQGSGGGWRYKPEPTSGDVSATVMQIMALKGAAEAGIYVPRETIENATRFMRSHFHEGEGGWRYRGSRGKAAFPRTAAGVVSMQSLGHQKDPLVRRGVQYIMKETAGSGMGGGSHFWYGHYYASVALYHFGGEDWKSYYPRMRDYIYGKWDGRRLDKVLDVSWATLILGVPYRYLPIYQR
jgi:hypothetical protein